MNRASNFKLKIPTLISLITDIFRLFYFKYYPFVYNIYIQYLKSHLNNQGFSIFIKHLMHAKINIEEILHKCINN